jgi:hypothetical protein
MLPTNEQIEVAAYHLWEQRGRHHGLDREDWDSARRQLVYSLNYEQVQDFDLCEPAVRVLGYRATRVCRFCERDSKLVRFAAPSAVVPIVRDPSLVTAAICQDCQSECLDPLAPDLRRFWESLGSAGSPRDNPSEMGAGGMFSLGAYKALVASALLMLPDQETPFFLDALEWVGNPDRDADQRLFAGTCCRAYLAPSGYARPWASLARRTDDDAPLPYMLAFVACDGVIVQIHLPMCSRDDDPGDDWVSLPERRFWWGDGWNFGQGRTTLLPLALAGGSGRSHGQRSLVEC